MIKILIAEDQSMLLGALAAMLDMEPDFEIIDTASDGKEALTLIKKLTVDIVLTDIEMPKLTGIELAQELKKLQHPAKVMILTTFARSGYLRRAMDSGVKGYLLIVATELVTNAWTEADPLSDNERKILRLSFEGLSTKEIAAQTSLSAGTVRNYLSEVISKLDANNRIDAARIAKQKGWL